MSKRGAPETIGHMLMKQVLDGCRVREGEVIDLRDRPTSVKPFYRSKDEYHALLADHVG